MIPPATTIPTDEELWSPEDPDKPNLAFLKDHLVHEGRLSEAQALAIIKQGTTLLSEEPNLLDVDAPITGAISFSFPLLLFADGTS